MKDPDKDYRQAVALFRYGLIADLARLDPGSKGRYALIEQKAAGEYTIPGSPVSVPTCSNAAAPV